MKPQVNQRNETLRFVAQGATTRHERAVVRESAIAVPASEAELKGAMPGSLGSSEI